MSYPHIAHVEIRNYRNFESLDIDTDEKQLIIGENATGKTNYINALQLILDPSLSEQDRILSEEDFSNTHNNPMQKGEEILISIYIADFEKKPALMCILENSVVTLKGKKLAKLTYIFQPIDKSDFSKGYHYIIFKGNDEKNKFDTFCRKYFNLKVIHALRDVESDLMFNRKSPLRAIIEKYKIDLTDEFYKDMVQAIKTQNRKLLGIDEIADISNNLKGRIDNVLNRYNNSSIDIDLAEENPNRLLSLLRILENGRNLSEASLGICNVIYMQLVLQQIQNGIPTFISYKFYEKMNEVQKQLIDNYYKKTERGNLIRNECVITNEDQDNIIETLSLLDETRNCTTILAIEEPEAHLHPSFQRMVYKDLFVNSQSSIILTTHSPHLASICPIKYIVEFRRNCNKLTDSTSAKNLLLTARETQNLQRFIDVNRGEIFFGKGVILVEGISEQILVPVFAEKMNIELDAKGIIICNINSTNFLPYLKLLCELNIPYVLITDGDPDCTVTGYDRIKHLCEERYSKEVLSTLKSEADWNTLFKEEGYFIGSSTLEFDIMKSFENNRNNAEIFNAFCYSTIGGETNKKHFKDNLISKNYEVCLKMIDSDYVGKGRFAQELSTCNIIKEDIPEYISLAITRICEMVGNNEH